MADYSDYKECTDCVHYELCLHQEKFLIEHNRKDLIRRYGFGLSEPEICCNFRDRSRFVELPCRVGDKVYCGSFGKLMEDEIICITIDDNETRVVLKRGISYDIDKINQMFFLTREQALREHESGA